MSILFLDFDGVLNSTTFTQSVRPIQEGETSVDFDAKRLDPKAIKLLNQIVKATRCTVIVSSTWRVNNNRHYLHWLLVSLGFDGYVWGCTPHMPESNRSEEIKVGLEWLKKDGFDVNNYVILDDSEITGHDGHIVRTNEHTGLTEADVAKAISLLGSYE